MQDEEEMEADVAYESNEDKGQESGVREVDDTE